MTDNGYPEFVLVGQAPRIFALHRPDEGDGVSAWVVVLPGGHALVVDPSGELIAQTSVERITARWTRRGNTRLVHVAEDPALRAA